jgi:cyanate permease
MTDWKSTASGILTGLIGTFTAIMTFQVPTALLNPQQTRTWLYVVAGCNLASIIGTVWVHIITQNADADAVALALKTGAAIAPSGEAVTPTAATLATTPPKEAIQ